MTVYITTEGGGDAIAADPPISTSVRWRLSEGLDTHSHPRPAHFTLLLIVVQGSPLDVKLPAARRSRGGCGAKGRKGQEHGGGGVCFRVELESVNEGEGAARCRRSAGQEVHGREAFLLGAGEASEEVTMAVVLSRRERGRGVNAEGAGANGGFVSMSNR